MTTASDRISRTNRMSVDAEAISFVHDDLRDPDPELFVDDDDFAVPHEGAVDEDVDGAARRAIELDDRTRTQPDDVAYLQPPSPELGGDFHVPRRSAT